MNEKERVIFEWMFVLVMRLYGIKAYDKKDFIEQFEKLNEEEIDKFIKNVLFEHQKDYRNTSDKLNKIADVFKKIS